MPLLWIPGSRRFSSHFFGPKRDNRRAPTTRFEWSVGEGFDEGRSRQHRAHGFALYADPPAVNDAEKPELQPPGLLQILLHHCFYVARRNGVQIQNIGDWNADGLVVHAYVASLTAWEQAKSITRG